MNNTIREILKKHIGRDDMVIVGVSGGPDSVYLLLQTLKHTKNIIVAHVNHQTRGMENSRDARFVEKLATSHDLPFSLHVIEKKKASKKNAAGNREDYFRRERYEFFEKLRAKHRARWILTAHHLNDNIETILFNLTKGSFLDGLSGIKVADARRRLLRPLLFTTKDEIIHHLKKTGTPYRHDSTNNNTRLSRNHMRHKVVPRLKIINASLEQTFAQNIVNLQELRAYLDEVTSSWLEQNQQEGSMTLESFLRLHPILQKSILFRLYADLYGPGSKLNQSHLEQLLKIIRQKFSNRKKEFGENYFLCLRRHNGKMLISIETKDAALPEFRLKKRRKTIQ